MNNTPNITTISKGTARWLEAATHHAQFIFGDVRAAWGTGYELRVFSNDDAYDVYVIIDNCEIVDKTFRTIDEAYNFVYAVLRPLAAERHAETIAALVAETMTQTRASDDVPEVGYFAPTSDPEIFAVGNVAGNPRDLLGGVEIRGTFYNFGGYWEHDVDDWGRAIYSFRLAKDPAPAVAVFPFGLVDEWDLIEKCSDMRYTGERDEVAAFEWYVDNAPADGVGVLCFLDGQLCYVSHDDYAAVACGTCGATYGDCGHDDAPSAPVCEVLPWVYGDEVTRGELLSDLDTLRDEVRDLRDEVARLRAELNNPREMRVSVDTPIEPGSLSLDDVNPHYLGNAYLEPKTVRETIFSHLNHLQWATNEVVEAMNGNRDPLTYADMAGDIRGEACGLWQLLVGLYGGAQ